MVKQSDYLAEEKALYPYLLVEPETKEILRYLLNAVVLHKDKEQGMLGFSYTSFDTGLNKGYVYPTPQLIKLLIDHGNLTLVCSKGEEYKISDVYGYMKNLTRKGV